MQSSRIFIRGLPPNLSNDEFRKYFENPVSITDAKLIPHRRIGYVGYKTHDAAVKAVKYFNKSFIRMSRIGVELARPVEELQRGSNHALPEGIAVQGEKRKYDAWKDSEDNPKLLEFLEVMQPSSKSKVWSNEGAIGTGAIESTLTQQPAVIEDEVPSDKEYDPLPKKRKTSTDRTQTRLVESPKHDRDSEPNSETEPLRASSPAMMDTDQTVAVNLPGSSDAEWLRSRTSRLLGLLDDEETEARLQNASLTESSDEDGDPANTLAIQPLAEAAEVKGRAELNEPSESEKITTLEKRKVHTISTGRLFLRNLSYETSEDDLKEVFAGYGGLEEVHIPRDSRSGSSKGFAYVQFDDPSIAERAMVECDGKSFQGRLIHVLPATAKKDTTLDDYAISKLPIKKQKEIKRRAEAASATFKWNAMYMNPDAVIASISSRLGIPKSAILDPTSSDAAVKQAHAETNIIQETKAYFSSNGVNLESFKSRAFSETVILVKNFPYGTTPTEIKNMFEAYGSVAKLLMPPSGTIAIVQMDQANQAQAAFKAFAYRKFKDTVLFLEKAPKDIFEASSASLIQGIKPPTSDAKLSTTDLLEKIGTDEPAASSTLFVRNLNFSTTTDQLRDLFRPLEGFMSARVKTKPDPKKAGHVLSMGFGFVEFASKEQAQTALAAMNGYKLEGHDLVVKSSHRGVDAAEQRRNEDNAKKVAGRRTKIIIKNLPFEATKKDVRSLFTPYGQLRSIRVPKKFDSSTRGFAFADFVTSREAENAIDALKDTHLLGRRLVLEFTTADTIDPEEEIEKMQQKVGKQANKVALQQLTSVGRKKFNVQDEEDLDD